MEEYLDIVDDNNRITEKIAKKSYIHQNGIWHREVACWIMNKEGEILVQKRAKTKEHAPGKWDITAGHVKPSEKTNEAMSREIQEELGIKVNKEDLLLKKENALYGKFIILKKGKKNYYLINLE